jgi:hypothetical protein
MNTSEKYSLIKQDIYKIWKGFLIAFSGAVVTYLTSISGMIDFSQFGQYSMVAQSGVMVVSSTIINALNKWIAATEYIETPVV